MRKLMTAVLTFALTASFAAAAHAAAVSVSFNNSNGSGVSMVPSDLAGAPNVRVANWNNFTSTTGTLGDNEAVTYSDGSTVGGGFQVTVAIASGIYGDRTSGTNDRRMYAGVIDTFTNSTASVTNIPFARYDVYAYMFDDGSMRAGEFTIGSTSYYLRGGVGNPDSTGAGYIISGETTNLGGSIKQANYVHFSNLTASSFNLVATAINAGDSVTRNKFSGFEIVAVPTPAALPAGLMLIGGVMIRRRKS